MNGAIGGEDPPRNQYGFRAPQVCKVVDITYRQLDYWARTELLMPSLRAADGSGTQRLYSFSDLVQLRVIRRLLDTGISLRKIRQAVEWLRSELDSDQPLKDATLLSDGVSILTSSNADETQQYLMDTLAKGQGVFAIAVGQVQRDLQGETLEMFPSEARPAASEAEEPEGGHEVAAN